MAEPTPIYLFRSERFGPGSSAIVCAAPTDLAVAAYGGGGHHDGEGLNRAFGGNAFYRNVETGRTFLAVWGTRNASRFRTALRSKSAIVIVREPPPAHLVLFEWKNQRPPTSMQRETD